MGRLDGRTALITGASRGIGRAIAQRYAAEGASVFLTATNRGLLDEAREAAAAAGARAWVHTADVSARVEVETVVTAALAAMGRIDVLVNNAGVYKASRFVDYAPEDFARIVDVNVNGAFHVMQLVLRAMIEQGSGKIVSIASTAGKWASMNQSAYNASKHALVGLTRCVALEAGPHGINVNAICPGYVRTDMLEQFRVHGEILGISFEQVLANARARVALGRVLEPEEIASLAVYLGSSESDGMTGQSILLDGGMVFV